MPYETVTLDIADRVATLRLNRPRALNALSKLMLEEMSAAVEEASRNDTLRALVVRGEGRAFCVGADLAYLESIFDNPPALDEFLALFADVLERLERFPVPTIAVAHGYALAGGLELLLACDLAIADEEARIGDQHVNVGLIPGGGSTARLPRRIGAQRALDLIYTGRWLTGREAAAWGLVLSAAPHDALNGEVEKLLAVLRPKSRKALGWVKHLVHHGQDLPIPDAAAYERDTFVQYVTASPDPREGVEAFRGKRQPKF